jgi:hypothetical protein
MRASIMAIAAGVVLSAGAISVPAAAMPGSPAGAAGTASNPLEQVACWRFGSHGWGWYPFCGPPPPPPPAFAAWADVPPSPNCRDTTVREQHWGETEVHHYRQCY